MNCISRSTLLICLVCCTACDAPASETNSVAISPTYEVHYDVAPDPADGSVVVEMTVNQSHGELRELSFSVADSDFSDLAAEGELDVGKQSLTWRPARSGGSLRWRVSVSHRRGNNGYDAWLSSGWGIFRAEDIIPRARTRTLVGAVSQTTLSFTLPAEWTVASEYSTLDGRNSVQHPETRFDQPRGWIAVGKLGIRRETIAGTRVTIAAPEGQSARRMDMLALLNWVLPELDRILPDAIPKLTIVSADDPMWRGALSAPHSIFIHADRPLISENATSTLVHEVFHVAFGKHSEPGSDWIIEGLAEYYSLELLMRGNAITAHRHELAMRKQEDWAGDAKKLCASRSSGATTALAVVVLRELDQELRNKSAGQFSLDDVVAGIATTSGRVSLHSLDRAAYNLLNDKAEALHSDKLSGCRRDLTVSGG